MKAYIVTEGEYDDYIILGVSDTFQGALLICNKSGHHRFYRYIIELWEDSKLICKYHTNGEKVE